MKMRYLIILIPLVYLYGLATIYLKVFPFYQLQEIQDLLSGPNVLENRVHDTAGLVPMDSLNQYPNRLVFLTYGQSNAANTGQLGYDVSEPVFMVYNGRAYKYSDPSVGATGINASVWGRVGDRLIQMGLADAVFFVNAAWGGASMDELANGHQYEYFESQMQQALETFGHVDGILFHHGERHNRKIPDKQSIGAATYREPFLEFRAKVSAITNAPVFLSQVSYCGDRGIDQEVLDVQDSLIRELDGVLRGPNTDTVTDVKYRLPDQCHFSSAGLDLLADMWIKAITAASED